MIAVAGGKGGSGKTTTTVGLARALSRRGAPVVAADADWDLPNLAELAAETQSRGTTSAGTQRAIGPDSTTVPDDVTTVPDDVTTVPEAATTVSNAVTTVVEAVRDGGRIHLDRSRPTILDAPELPRSVDATAVLGSLGDALSDETPTLLDSPAGASPDAAAPLRAADRCLLVTPLRRSALRDAAKTAAIARRLGCPPIGAVAVRTDSVPEPVSDLLGCPVMGRIPEAGPKPLADTAVRAAYDDLARRLVDEYGRSRWRVA